MCLFNAKHDKKIINAFGINKHTKALYMGIVNKLENTNHSDTYADERLT